MLAEVNHQAHSQSSKRYAKVESDPFEPATETDGDAHDDGEQTGADSVYVNDISRFSDRKTIDDLEEGTEVTVPQGETDEKNSCKDNGTHNSSVQQAVGDEGLRGNALFVQGKCDEH
ncbi:unnamed protein product [Periconia digitata]|uniref:Uncharacterized protein n=1 Tax=Periconia digitata TaxID=1303443 RepID=A0A9W4UKE5_9PLEO|nr:unnamed protein product [Periconia digitata]